MKEKILDRFLHGILALLLSSGVFMSMLGLLDLTGQIIPGLLLMAVIIAVMETARQWKVALTGLGFLSVICLLLWLFVFHGLTTFADILRAATLQVNGIPGALPLVGGKAAVLLSILCAVSGFFFSLRNVGAAPSLVLCAGVGIAIWLGDRPDLLPFFLPAIAASLTILFASRHMESALFRLLPMASLLVLIAYLFTPKGGLTVEPMKKRADDLRQKIMDTLFFTEARDVFSLAAEGYYSQGLNQLGGLAEPTTRPVMQVSTPRIVYLRGAIMDDYNGRIWKNTTGGRRYLWQATRWHNTRDTLFDMLRPPESLHNAFTEPVTIHIRMLTDSASSLFVPQRVRSLQTGGDLIAYFNNSSEIFATRNLTAGDTWSVEAPLFTSGDAGLSTLITAASALDDPGYDTILEQYTRIPEHLEEPVYALAFGACEGAATPYEKAFAIQNWLSRTYRYTLDVPDQPENLDFVTNFLLNTRAGYCIHFASAMTILCRMVGLPARYIEGYLAEPDAEGHAYVTGLNGHAWTEIYFPSFGWVTFDATPRQGSGSTTSINQPEDLPDDIPPEEETPSEEETPPDDETPPEDNPPEDDPSDDLPEEDEPNNHFPHVWPWLILLFLGILLGLRIWLTSPESKERKASDANAFGIWLRDLMLLLKSAGFEPAGGESPMAFMRRVDNTHRYPVVLGTAGECISLISYSRTEAIESDIRLLRESARCLKHQLPLLSRIKYLASRVLGK